MKFLTNEDFTVTRILYIRHGEVPGNVPDPATYIYTGCKTDQSLTEKGKAQAEVCAQRMLEFGKIAALYSSDLKRAVETAEPIAKQLGLEIQQRHDLREIDWGVADGQPVKKMIEEWESLAETIKQKYPDRKVQWTYLPIFQGAENYNALLARTSKELQTIASLHPGETVIVVGHGRVLKTLIAEAKDSEENIPYPSNCGIAEFTVSSDGSIRFIQVFEN